MRLCTREDFAKRDNLEWFKSYEDYGMADSLICPDLDGAVVENL